MEYLFVSALNIFDRVFSNVKVILLLMISRTLDHCLIKSQNSGFP